MKNQQQAGVEAANSWDYLYKKPAEFICQGAGLTWPELHFQKPPRFTSGLLDTSNRKSSAVHLCCSFRTAVGAHGGERKTACQGAFMFISLTVGSVS